MGFRFGDILRYRWTVDLEIRWPLEVSLLASFLVDWPLFRTDMLDITIFATRLAELLLPRPVSFSSLCPPLTRESQRQMVRWLTSSASVTWLWVMPPTARGPIDSVPWHPGHPVHTRQALPRKRPLFTSRPVRATAVEGHVTGRLPMRLESQPRRNSINGYCPYRQNQDCGRVWH